MSSISEIFKDDQSFKNFTPENWKNLGELDDDKQLEALQKMENYMAEKQGRKARTVEDVRLKKGDYGEFNYGKPNVIRIDLKQLNNNEKLDGKDSFYAMAVVIHEGRHAYQYDAANKEQQLKDNSFSEKDIKAMGRNFISGFDSNASNYISQLTESDAFEYTTKILGELKKQFVTLGDSNYGSFEVFLRAQEEAMGRLKRMAIRHYGGNNGFDQYGEEFAKEFRRAERRTIGNVNKDYKKLKKETKAIVSKIDKFECRGDEASIKRVIDEFKEKYGYDNPKALLETIEKFDADKGLAYNGEEKGASINYEEYNSKPNYNGVKTMSDKTSEKPLKESTEPVKSPSELTDKELADNVVRLQKEIDNIDTRLTSEPDKPEDQLSDKDRQDLTKDLAKVTREHSEHMDEVVKRPNKAEIVNMIEQTQSEDRTNGRDKTLDTRHH
ncbi:MAG: hypothetical protein LBH74_00710 [Nitrososphaerota archaeon]|nr:hypothetical protein [Nitrososphaerota archaeon]